MIDLYLLEQLVAVKNHKTLIKASEELGISQPALSKSMKKLESLLQMELFHRTNRKIELNETGLFLAQKAEHYLFEGESMLTQVRNFDRSLHNISVGSCAPIPFWEVSPVLSAAFPQMSITTETRVDEVLLSGLKNDLYQMIILSYPPIEDEFYCARFLSEKMFLSVPKDHPFYTKDKISPEELSDQFLIAFNEIGVWNDWIKRNFPGIKLMLVNDPSNLHDAIGLGAALSFVSDYIIKTERNNPDQKIIPLDLTDDTIDYYLVCKKSEYTKYRKVIQRLIRVD